MNKKRGLKLMQVLKYIEDSFNFFSLKAKVSLFLLPLLIFSLLFFYFDKKDNEIVLYKNENISKKLKSIKMNENIVDILKNIESHANNNSLNIKAISSGKNSIKLELNTDKKRIIKFLKYLEDYNSFSELKSLSIVGKKLKLELVFENMYIKDNNDLNSRIAKLENEKKIFLNLHAIIGKKVFINDKWLEVNEKYKNYKVIKINKNNVHLQDEYEIIKLKMYKNENI